MVMVILMPYLFALREFSLSRCIVREFIPPGYCPVKGAEFPARSRKVALKAICLCRITRLYALGSSARPTSVRCLRSGFSTVRSRDSDFALKEAARARL